MVNSKRSISEYGLIIIFISIMVIVLISIFAMNGFKLNNTNSNYNFTSANPYQRNSCIATYESLCSAPTVSSDGFISSLSQLTNTKWKVATIAFVKKGLIMPEKITSLYSYPNGSLIAREVVNKKIVSNAEISNLDDGYIIETVFNNSYSIKSNTIGYSYIIPNKTGYVVYGSIWAIYELTNSSVKGPFYSMRMANVTIVT